MADSPIVCTLSPEALRARKEGPLTRVAGLSTQTVKLPDGYRLKLTPEPGTLRVIAEMIEAERQCCRFLRFVVTIVAEAGPIQLDVTGPKGTQEFLETLLDIK
jgi:hypothetical protein